MNIFFIIELFDKHGNLLNSIMLFIVVGCYDNS
jgi:hypothetical protein